MEIKSAHTAVGCILSALQTSKTSPVPSLTILRNGIVRIVFSESKRKMKMMGKIKISWMI
jgi:hypothetical protein